MKNKNRFSLFLSAAALSVGALSMPVQASDVVIGEPNWPSAKATAWVVKAIAEQELGIRVDISPGNNAVIFKAMDRGRGDIDVHPEVWMPNQQNLTDQYISKGTVMMSAKPYDVVQGYCVTRMTAEKYGIRSVYDLADPENARLFDSNGDGKGEMWIGGAGWASTPIEKVRARDYGFGEFFDLQVLDETLALASLDDAVRKDRPFVSYCYKPHHVFKLHELVMLEEPAHDPAKWNMVQPTDDPDWYQKSSISVAWTNATVHLAWSSSLNDKEAEFTRLLSNIQMDSDTISDWIYALVVEKKDAESYARDWVRNNPDKVSRWAGL